MEYMILTFMVQPEGDYHVSECLELGTASFGRGEREALENLTDATEVYLCTLEDLRDCRRTLEEKAIQVYSYEPTPHKVRTARLPVGAVVYAKVMPLQRSPA